MSARLTAGKRSFARQAGGTFLVRIGGAALGLVTAVAVSRALGPAGRGEFAAAMALAAMGMQIGNLGFPSSNTYFVSKEPGLLPVLLGNSLLIAGAIGSALALVFALLKFGAGMFEQTGPMLVFAALLWIPFGLAYLLLTNLLLGIGLVARFNAAELALRVATLLGTVGAVLVWPAASAVALFAIALVAQAAAAIMAYSAIPAHGRRPVAVSWTVLKRQIPFSLRSYVALVLAFVLLKIDLLMVQAISGNAEAGYYSIAASMADLLYMLPAAIGLILFPRLAGTSDAGHRARATSTLMGYTGLLMGAAAAVSWIVAPLAIRLLFGAEFLPAVGMFRILAVAICLYGLNNILSNHFMAEGLPWPAVWVWVVAVVVNLALNLAWIPAYGGAGAASASLVAYAVVLVLQGALFFRATGVR
jgi:O-antigen/teichoic acid export membrane protein